MSRDVLTVGSTMRIPLLYRGEYSQWVGRFMNYLEEQTDGEAMINLIKNGVQPLPRVTQVSIAGTTSTEQPPLKDKSMCVAIQKIIAELNFKFLNNLQPEWKQYATIMRQNKNLMDINIDALYNILKQNQEDVNDAMGSKKKTVVVTSDPLALIAEKTNVSKSKKKVVVSSKSKRSEADDLKSECESEFETSEYYDNSTNYGLFVNNDDDQEIFHGAIESASENFIENHIDSQKDYDKSDNRVEKANQQSKDFENQNKDLQDKYDVLKNQTTTFEINNELNEQMKELIVKNNDLLAQTKIADQQVLFDKMSVQMVELDKHVRDLKNTVLEKDFKISELEECVRNKDLEIEKCLERLNVCKNKLNKMGQTNQTVHMIMPSKDNLYNGRKGIGFENPSYFEKAKDLRLTLYDEKVIGLGILVRNKMSRDVITVGSTMWIPLLYRGEYSQLRERFMNYLEEQTDEWKQYGTLMRQTKNLMDINIDALYNILKQNQGDVNDALGYRKKAVVVTSDLLALVAEKTKVSKCKEKVVVQSESEESDDEDISDLKNITALLAKAFNRKKYYAKPTNNSLRTYSASFSANKKPEYVKSKEKKEDKKVDEKKRDMSKVKCYSCKKEGYFSKDCKKANVKYYNYYKTKMFLDKKDSDKQVLLAEDQAWMESSSDSDQEIHANMVFMAKMEKVLSDSEECSSSSEETIAEISYYTSDSESESEYETSEYYDKSTNYGLFVDTDDDQEIFHDASENFNENHVVSQIDHDESEVFHNDYKEKDHLVDKLIKKFNQKIAKCQKRIEKANQQSKDLENQNKDLQDKYDVLKNQKINLEIIESLKSKDFESSENAISESKNQSENDCQVVEKRCDQVENSKVIAPGMFKLNVSQSVSPISASKTSCASKNVENKTKRKRHLDTLSSVRRPKHSSVIWKKKWSSNTSNDDLSSVSHSKLNKDVKRYSCKDFLSCNNAHLGDTRSAYACNDAMNVSCNSSLYASYDENDLFIFDDVSVRNSQVSKMPFRKKPSDSLNVRSKSNSNKSLPRTMHRWFPIMQPLAEPVARWIPKVKRQIDKISKTPNSSGPIFKWVHKVS
nr:nucleolar protein 58-like [Tanacetum cinerariifolium]